MNEPIKYPDGYLEFGASGCGCCSPWTKRGGQHVNSTSSWVKLDYMGDAMRNSRIVLISTVPAYKAKRLIEGCKTLAEVEDFLLSY